MNPLLIGILGTLVVGSGAGFAAFQMWEMGDIASVSDDACRAAAPTAAGEGDGLVRFTVDNRAAAQRVWVCALDRDLHVVALREAIVPGDAVTNLDLRVPTGRYFAHVEVPVGDDAAAATSTKNLYLCAHHAERSNVELFPGGGISVGSGPNDCFDPGEEEPTTSANRAEVLLARSVHEPPGGPALAVGVGAASLAGLAFALRPRLHLLGLLLFTRLTRPTVLRQETRARIHDLVEVEPGIHGNAIAARLGVARGEALYHLHVLVREKSLVRVENWGLRSFFVAGAYDPRQMRAMAALRSAALERMYGAVRGQPDATLPDIARAAGYSLARASRLARRLEEAGLIERCARGRGLVLSPVDRAVPGWTAA